MISHHVHVRSCALRPSRLQAPPTFFRRPLPHVPLPGTAARTIGCDCSRTVPAHRIPRVSATVSASLRRPLLSRAFIHIFKYARISSLRGFPLCRPLPRLLCAPSRAYRLPPPSCWCALPCRSARFCPHRESAASLPAASAGTFTSRRRTDVFIVLRPFLCIFSCTAAALYATSQKTVDIRRRLC